MSKAEDKIPVYLSKKQWRLAYMILFSGRTPPHEFGEVKVTDLNEIIEAIKEVLGE